MLLGVILMRYSHSWYSRFCRFKGRMLHNGIHILSHLRLLLRWTLYATCMGLIVGAIGTAFVYAIQIVTTFRSNHPWILAALPFGGFLIIWLYHISRDQNDKGTNMVLASLRSETELPLQMAPLIFISTIITHLCGGSAGREGAALQLGGSIGNLFSHILKLAERDKQVLILCGMSAAFSAIFRTPIAAPIFAMEVVCVGAMRYAALVPCTIASLAASWLAGKAGIPLAKFSVTGIPTLQIVPALQILLLGICCAAVSILFCILLRKTEQILQHYFPNPYLRILTASIILWFLIFLVQSPAYLGIGTDIIQNALSGEVVWYAFLAKMIFTSVTLGGGFKGGEIVPSFFVGATFGCLFGHWVGLSPSFCAAVGIASLFCGVTNCPLASLLIAVELFGTKGLPYILLAISVSYLLSGYYGLYGEQSFLSSKYTGQHIHHKTKKI